jgi:hypothetical protein
LDRIARLLLLKELQLFRPAPPRFYQVRYADVAEDALNGLRRDSHIVDALQPDARAAGAKLVLESRWGIRATTHHQFGAVAAREPRH